MKILCNITRAGARFAKYEAKRIEVRSKDGVFVIFSNKTLQCCLNGCIKVVTDTETISILEGTVFFDQNSALICAI